MKLDNTNKFCSTVEINDCLFFHIQGIAVNYSAIYYIMRNSIFIKVMVVVFNLNIFIRCQNYTFDR
jgi:hypothetical protein